jgi:DNA-binding transcriptional ArsR family regulator
VSEPRNEAGSGIAGGTDPGDLASNVASRSVAGPAPITNIEDPRWVRAISHPLRIRILAMLDEREASPVVLAGKLGQPLGTVSYHVRTLYELGLLDLVGTRPRRGATEHFYRAHSHPTFDDEAWEQLGTVPKQRMISAVLQQINEYASRSAAAGGFDRADAHFTRTGMQLDARGWTDLAKATKRWLEQTARIEDASTKRLQKAPHSAIDVGLVILLFEALPFSAEDPQPAAPAKPRRRATAAGGRARQS